MQNHLDISSKTQFWLRILQSCTKTLTLDMSGPAKSWFGHVRTWKVVIWSCPDLSKRTSTYCKPAEISLFLSQIMIDSQMMIDGPHMGPYGPIWALMGPIWVLLDRSGHDQITTFGPISHASGPKLSFWRNFLMILHGFCWRSWKTYFFNQKTKHLITKIQENI